MASSASVAPLASNSDSLASNSDSLASNSTPASVSASDALLILSAMSHGTWD